MNNNKMAFNVSSRLIQACAASLQVGGVQRSADCSGGAFRAGDGAREEEAAHVGDQTAKL